MPTYVYKFVDTGETIEVQQGFHDDTLTEIAHPDSGAMLPVKKVFTPVGVTFKGSGFFKTDNRGKKSATTPSAGTTSGAESGASTPSSTTTDSASPSAGSSGSSSSAGSSGSSPAST